MTTMWTQDGGGEGGRTAEAVISGQGPGRGPGPRAEAAPIPSGESGRLDDRIGSGILDAGAEGALDDLTRLAATICATPIALVNLVDAGQPRLKSIVGLAINESRRDAAFCARAILQGDLLIVPDARADPLFAGSPLVVAEPFIRFYAGAPLIAPGGRAIGTLCVFDHVPRALDAEKSEALRALARQVIDRIELRRQAAELACANAELRAAERALGAQRAEYRSLVENLPLFVFRKDRDGRFTFANERFCAQLGRPLEAVLGRTDADFYPPEMAAKYRDDDLKVMATGLHLEMIEEHHAPGGAPGWVRVTKVPIRGASGAVVGVQGLFEDVTERVRAERELRASQARFRRLIEADVIGIIAADVNGRITEANDAFLRMLGADRPELDAGRIRWDDLTPPEFRDRVGRAVEEFRGGRGCAAFETEFYRKDGGRVPVLVGAVPLEDAGTTEGIAFVLDISERRRIEAELAHERSLLHALLENVPDRIYFKDLASRFTRVGRETARMFGLDDPCRIIGLTDADLFGPEHARAARGDELEVMRTGRPILKKEECETWPDGRLTWSLTTKMPLRDDRGRIVGTFGVSTDITRLKRVEDELREQSARLAQMHAALEDQNRRLAELATTDGLTDLVNRRAFHEALAIASSLATRQGLPLSLAMLDVDHFKAYNDSFGHPAGDQVLRAVADLLRRNVREHDVAARYGGEEFAILLPGADASAALEVAGRVREAIAGHAWPLQAVTVSLGVATAGPRAASIPDLIEEADRALYRSKRRGRDRVTHADEAAATPSGFVAASP